MSEQLKPCPFCGSNVIGVSDGCVPDMPKWMQCIECMAEGPTGETASKKAAIAAWNRRAETKESGE